MKPYQLLIFDWEGTLNDSGAHMKSCIGLALEELHLPEPSLDELIEHLGLDAETLLSRLCADHDSATRARLVSRFRHHYFIKSRLFQLFPEVHTQLSLLKDAGYLIAIATGMGHTSLQLALDQTLLAHMIDCTRTADRTRSKPDPLMLIEIMDTLGVSPASTLMIGDTESDLQLAHNAGVDSVAISHYHEVHSQLRDCKPILCIENITQLREWLLS